MTPTPYIWGGRSHGTQNPNAGRGDAHFPAFRAKACMSLPNTETVCTVKRMR